MILTTIDNIPLYSTLQEALSWASANGLTGYHTPMYQGTLGYMGGATHSTAVVAGSTSTTINTQQTFSNTTTSSTSSSSTSSSGGGGY